jgi:hypothetical protein
LSIEIVPFVDRYFPMNVEKVLLSLHYAVISGALKKAYDIHGAK